MTPPADSYLQSQFLQTYYRTVLQNSTGPSFPTLCTRVQALRLCTGRTAHRESRVLTLPFHDHGTRSGWGVSVTPRPLFTPGKDPVPIAQEAEWTLGPVWTGVEYLASTGIRSPDRSARSQLLYRLLPDTVPNSIHVNLFKFIFLYFSVTYLVLEDNFIPHIINTILPTYGSNSARITKPPLCVQSVIRNT